MLFRKLQIFTVAYKNIKVEMNEGLVIRSPNSIALMTTNCKVLYIKDVRNLPGFFIQSG